MSNSNKAERCRNCGAQETLKDLGFIGQIAPFFLKRVFGVRLGTVRSSAGWKQVVRRFVRWPQSLLERVNQPTALVEVQLCSRCSFVQTKLPFPEESINRLYLDYREDSYNRERIEFEPGYGKVFAEVGHSPIELDSRLTAATTFLKRHIPAQENFTILDFGGSDGKFMPRLEGQKFVYEISAVEPVPGVTRVHSEAELGTYSLVQLAHVIEHVVEPLALVTHVASRVGEGGFLYLETPQEISEKERADLKLGKRMVGIHEHINSYCPQAVRALLETAGFAVIDIEATSVNVGWAKATHIRALGKKRRSVV